MAFACGAISLTTHLRRSQVAMNMAARFITGLGRTARRRESLERCKWLDVRELTYYHFLLQMWKTVHWSIPKYMASKITIENGHVLTTAAPRLQITAGSYRWKNGPKLEFTDGGIQNRNKYF